MDNQDFSVNTPSQQPINKVISTGFKVEGWDYRARVIKNVIFGIVLLVLGIYVAYKGNLAFGAVVILIGVLMFLGAWFYWWRSKSLVKGKFYAPDNKNVNE